MRKDLFRRCPQGVVQALLHTHRGGAAFQRPTLGLCVLRVQITVTIKVVLPPKALVITAAVTV
jgi:hypothetical protein